MKKLIFAVAFVFAPMNTNVLAFEPETLWPSLLDPSANYHKGESSTFSTFNPETNSFTTGRASDIGGGTTVIQTYDFGTQQFGTTTITTMPGMLPSIITPIGELGK